MQGLESRLFACFHDGIIFVHAMIYEHYVCIYIYMLNIIRYDGLITAVPYKKSTAATSS